MTTDEGEEEDAATEDERASRLRKRREKTREVAEQVEESDQSEMSESSKTSKTSKMSETAESDKPSKSAEPSEQSETDESDQASVREEYTGVYMYLPEDLRDELNLRFDELNLQYKREYGTSLEKNRDFYPAVIRAALEGREIDDVLDGLQNEGEDDV
jgi:flagellar biosynthesis GTPase FlhF